MDIRRLTEHDAQAFWNFRLSALESEPRAFAESVDEHLQTPVATYTDRFRAGGLDSFVLGAFDQSALVATAGFYRNQRNKLRHKGLVWGVFVATSHRGRGVARALVTRLVEIARTVPDLHCLLLTVATTQHSARRLYRSAGFRSFGIEPRALRVDGDYVDEEHMVLELTS